MFDQPFLRPIDGKSGSATPTAEFGIQLIHQKNQLIMFPGGPTANAVEIHTMMIKRKGINSEETSQIGSLQLA